MPKRTLDYMKRKNKEGGYSFFSYDHMKFFRSPIVQSSYKPLIDTNYVVVRHYHGNCWYLFNEENGELTYFSGNFIREKFVNDNQRVE